MGNYRTAPRFYFFTSLTNQKGKTIETYSYDSFGNLKRQGNKTKNRFTYTGREYDKETGLYYYRNRYYDPKVGRFLTQDPLGMIDGPNFYSYVNNNPVNWVDSGGESSEKNVGGYRVRIDPPVAPGQQIHGHIKGALRSNRNFYTVINKDGTFSHGYSTPVPKNNVLRSYLKSKGFTIFSVVPALLNAVDYARQMEEARKAPK